jgi:hypothetical protein
MEPFRQTAATVMACAMITTLVTTPASAQDRRTVLFVDVGAASIGHHDSEQGTAPIFGGGAAFQLSPLFVVEADVHTGHVDHVFGRAQHDFTEVTFTGSLLFRGSVAERVHLVAGGGLGLQRAHTEVDEPPIPAVDRTETVRLFHGRVGADWDVSSRLVLRTHGVLWMGAGLDWVAGARVGLGFRF